MKYKVLIPQDISELGKNYLKDHDCEIRVLDDCSVENICKNVVDCDAIIARTASFPKEVFISGKNLKVIARHGVGYDNIDIAAAKKYKVKVCYTPEANSESVAEHTIALMLACAKNIVYMDKITRNGGWELRNKMKTADISGKTLGIIGFGRIGKLVAKKAALGLDMKILTLRHHRNDDLPEYVEDCSDINEIFTTSDFVSVHSALTEETLNIVNKERLELMKPTAFLINTSRGSEVDEAALYEALKSGTIAGAALDVFEKEPASKDNPLFQLDNVIVSPHNAAATKASMDRMGLHAAIGAVQVLYGQEVSWPVKED